MTNEVSEIIVAAESLSLSLKSLTPELLTVVGVIALGYVVRSTPLSTRWIPLVLYLLGPLAYVLMVSSPGDQPANIPYPQVRQALLGIVLTGIAQGAYELFVKAVIKWVKKKVGNWIGTGDTEITTGK